MHLELKIKENSIICNLEISLKGSVISITNIENQNTQKFYDSKETDTDWLKLYFTLSKIEFTENSHIKKEGRIYTQKLVIINNNNTKDRSERIEKILKLKYIKIMKNNGTVIIIGRNDFSQNASPKIDFSSSKTVTKITIITKTMFPIGFLA